MALADIISDLPPTPLIRIFYKEHVFLLKCEFMAMGGTHYDRIAPHVLNCNPLLAYLGLNTSNRFNEAIWR